VFGLGVACVKGGFVLGLNVPGCTSEFPQDYCLPRSLSLFCDRLSSRCPLLPSLALFLSTFDTFESILPYSCALFLNHQESLARLPLRRFLCTSSSSHHLHLRLSMGKDPPPYSVSLSASSLSSYCVTPFLFSLGCDLFRFIHCFHPGNLVQATLLFPRCAPALHDPVIQIRRSYPACRFAEFCRPPSQATRFQDFCLLSRPAFPPPHVAPLCIAQISRLSLELVLFPPPLPEPSLLPVW